MGKANYDHTYCNTPITLLSQELLMQYSLTIASSLCVCCMLTLLIGVSFCLPVLAVKPLSAVNVAVNICVNVISHWYV